MILLIDCNCVILGPTQCRNFDDHRKHIAKSHDNRNICFSHLKRTLANGDMVNRDWVVYSPSKNAIFCFVCRLFGSFNIFDVYKSTGFTDFHNANRSFAQHEKSQQHLRNELDYKTRAKKSQSTTIDSNILNQNRSEAEYWRKILTRIVAVIKFIGSRGLAFRGADQNFGSIYNGNFLGTLELLSQFDTLIASHIARYGNKGKGELFSSSPSSKLTF